MREVPCLVDGEGAVAVDADVAEDTRVAVDRHSMLHSQQVKVLFRESTPSALMTHQMSSIAHLIPLQSGS